LFPYNRSLCSKTSLFENQNFRIITKDQRCLCPNVEKIEIDQYEILEPTYEFSESDYFMLEPIEKLTIYSRIDLLFRADLNNLKELYTNVSKDYPDTQLQFPFLRCPQQTLHKTKVPVKADNVECFTIECFNSGSEAITLSSSLKLYPKLKRFSFINMASGKFGIEIL
jgi:hypothetical protein